MLLIAAQVGKSLLTVRRAGKFAGRSSASIMTRHFGTLFAAQRVYYLATVTLVTIRKRVLALEESSGDASCVVLCNKFGMPMSAMGQ